MNLAMTALKFLPFSMDRGGTKLIFSNEIAKPHAA
jgi:hypothetical protein